MRTTALLTVALALLTALSMFGATPLTAHVSVTGPAGTATVANPTLPKAMTPQASPAVSPTFPTPVYATSCTVYGAPHGTQYFPAGVGTVWSATDVVQGPCNINGTVTLNQNLVVNGSISFNGATVTLDSGGGTNAANSAYCPGSHPICDWERSITIEKGGSLSVVNSTLTVANQTSGKYGGPFPIVLDHDSMVTGLPTSANPGSAQTCTGVTPTFVAENSALQGGIYVSWGTANFYSTGVGSAFMGSDDSYLCSLDTYAYVNKVTLNGTFDFSGATAFIDNLQQSWYADLNGATYSPTLATGTESGHAIYTFVLLNYSGSNPSLTLDTNYLTSGHGGFGAYNNTYALQVAQADSFSPVYTVGTSPLVTCAIRQSLTVALPGGANRYGCVHVAPPSGYGSVVPSHTIYVNDMNLTYDSTSSTAFLYTDHYAGGAGLTSNGAVGHNDTFVVADSTILLQAGSSMSAMVVDNQESLYGTSDSAVATNVTLSGDTVALGQYWNTSAFTAPEYFPSTSIGWNASNLNQYNSLLLFSTGGNVTVSGLTASLPSDQQQEAYATGAYYAASLGTIALYNWEPSFMVTGSTFTDTSSHNSWDEPNFIHVGIPDPGTAVPLGIPSGQVSAFPYIGTNGLPAAVSFFTVAGNTFTANSMNNSGMMLTQATALGSTQQCVSMSDAAVADEGGGGGGTYQGQLLAYGNTFTLKGALYSCADTNSYGAFSWQDAKATATVFNNTATITVTGGQAGGTPLGFFVDDSLAKAQTAIAPVLFPLINLTANKVSITDKDTNTGIPAWWAASRVASDTYGSGTDPSFFFEQTADIQAEFGTATHQGDPTYNTANPLSTGVVSAVDNTITLVGASSLPSMSNWSATGVSYCANAWTYSGYNPAPASPPTTPCLGDVIGFGSMGEEVMSNMVGNTISLSGWGSVVAGQWFSRLAGGIYTSNVYAASGVDAAGYVDHGPWMPNVVGNDITLSTHALFITGNPLGLSVSQGTAGSTDYYPVGRQLVSEVGVSYTGSSAFNLYVGANTWAASGDSFFAFQPYNTVVSGDTTTPRVLLSSTSALPVSNTPMWNLLYTAGAHASGEVLATGTGIYSTTEVAFGTVLGLGIEPSFNGALSAAGFSYVTSTDTVGVLAGGALVWVDEYSIDQGTYQNGGSVFSRDMSVNYNNTPVFTVPTGSESAWSIEATEGNGAALYGLGPLGQYSLSEHFSIVVDNGTAGVWGVGAGSLPAGANAVAIQQDLRNNGALLLNNSVPEYNPSAYVSLPTLCTNAELAKEQASAASNCVAVQPLAPGQGAGSNPPATQSALVTCTATALFAPLSAETTNAALSVAANDPIPCQTLARNVSGAAPVLGMVAVNAITTGASGAGVQFPGGSGSFVLGVPYSTTVQAQSGAVYTFPTSLLAAGFSSNMTEATMVLMPWEMNTSLVDAQDVAEACRAGTYNSGCLSPYVIYSGVTDPSTSGFGGGTIIAYRFGAIPYLQGVPLLNVNLVFGGLSVNGSYSFYVDDSRVSSAITVDDYGSYTYDRTVTGNATFSLVDNSFSSVGAAPQTSLTTAEWALILSGVAAAVLVTVFAVFYRNHITRGGGKSSPSTEAKKAANKRAT